MLNSSLSPAKGMGDTSFRCHHCVQVIEEGMPVYMCRDASYCSLGCRKRGRSVEYARLIGGPDCASASNLSVSAWSSAASETTCTSSKCTADTVSGRGVLGWILSAGFRHLSAMAGGTELLRIGSAAGGWAAVTEANAELCPASVLNRSCERFLDLASGDQFEGKGSCSDFVRMIEGSA
eukprot:TRINITY_DN24870_c0_g1_i1.p1 TRINITY_DN24870_c0_g1~~TRINITY_DN24870_c0_g1_i1.p1  ORF type:complete len:179 (+),score=25.61 TRINITY_DN24870_c0_g1_i1:122-658(+)